MSVLCSIVKMAIQAPKRTAAIDDRRRYSFGQLLAGAMFLAEQIDANTTARHVGILLPTGGAFPTALLATWLARRVAVPLNYLLSPQELTHVVCDSDIDTILTAGPMLDFLAQAHGAKDDHRATANPIPSNIKLLQVDKTDFTGVPPFRWPPVYRRDDLAVVLYTSGTSGRPKGVMLTHGNLHSNVRAAIAHAHLTQANIFLGVLPQFHSFGLTALTLLPLSLGATTIYSARFTPKKIVGLIRTHRPDIMVAIPSMYAALLSVKDAKPDDFSSIQLAVSGGEPLPQAVLDQCQSQLGLGLLEGYGLTETSPMTHWCTPGSNKTKSVGTPLPGVSAVIVDDQNRPVPTGQEGHILIAGPNVMKGYYKLPKETQQVFVELRPPAAPNDKPMPKRFFRTGDIGRIDRDGFLFITGRYKEMLIIGGENVFPREIEEVLNHHPSVRDSAVIGKPDALRGELPVAFVEIHEEASFDEPALRTWCRDRLAGYKVPRQIHLIQALPRNATGKILRRQLPKV